MEKQQIVEGLLYPLWVGIPKKMKKSQMANTWNIFSNWVKSSSRKKTLPLFYDEILRKLNIVIESPYIERVEKVINSGEDAAVLKMLKNETEFLILSTRLLHQQLKEEYAATKQQNAND